MTRRLLLTMSSTTWLVGLYLLYARFITPQIEPIDRIPAQPQAVEIDTDPSSFVQGEQKSVAERFLPDQNWAKVAENQFHFGDLFVYANVVEQNGEKGEMRFVPFAMVWKNPNGPPDELPLRVTADAAVIRFESTFDLSGKQPGRPVFGSLEGDVRIDGPNGLVIQGRTFTFSEEALRLWCDSDILFRYGPHHGTGHGLQVDFLPGTGPNLSADQPRLGGLRSVTLLRQVAVHLLGEQRSIDQPRRSPLKPGEQLNVESDGRLQYDLEAGLMTFDQNVRVKHPTTTGKDDSIRCDLMTLVLSSTSGFTNGVASPENEINLASNEQPVVRNNPIQSWVPKTLLLEKLLADGSGKSRVEMISPNRSLYGNAAQVEYDMLRKTVILRDPGAVNVRQGPHEMHSPEITLVMSDSSNEIKRVVALGIGSASSRLSDGRLVTAKWQHQLIKSTDPKVQLDIVEMQGNATIALDTEYELKGEALRAWMLPMTSGNSRKGDHTPQIQRLAGVGQVILKSPQAIASSNWLDVRIESMRLPEDASQRSPQSRQSAVGKRRVPSRAAAKTNQRLTRRPPLNIKAESIQAEVARDPLDTEKIAILDLKAERTVDVSQPGFERQAAVNLTGSWVHLKNFPANQELVELVGAPAQIASGDTILQGPDIQLDRGRNSLTVNGPGSIQYPLMQSLDGESLDRPQMLHVGWEESLTFDGSTAKFFEKVTARLQHTTMRCNAMHVSLLKPLRFDDQGIQGVSMDQVQLAKVLCENKVEVESSVYRNNSIESRSFGKLGQFVIDNVTGETNALGPGHFVEWKRNKPRAESRANSKNGRTVIPELSTGNWIYSRIDFHGNLKGNLRERFTTFEDHVEIVYGPVTHATDKIDPDKLPDGSAGMTCDSLRVEQFAETLTNAAFVKLSAEGNTKLELAWDGQPWHAQADEVKFDESKDYYLLRSNGNQKVVINRQPTTEDPRGHIICSRVEIFRTRREFKFHKATELNGLQQ